MFKRKKLNSIWYGPRLLALIGLLTIVVPVILELGLRCLGLLGIKVGMLTIVISISRYAGIGLLVLFSILLAIEFIQDHLLDRRYHQERHTKLMNSDGSYECQYCGCRKIGINDKHCPVCGRDLA
jgi:uncharacterized paraquat-inducible protein A